MSAQIRRVVDLLFVLQGHVMHGLGNRQIASLVGQLESTTIRDLQLLADLGLTERIPGHEKQWRLTPRICQLALALQHEFAREQTRVDDTINRYTRNQKKD